ncbi:MAG: dephospho-CoA kinase [Planctomycetota bacterium]|nr:dephospho-CoA kinase [Planctomycetota bacterium]
MSARREETRDGEAVVLGIAGGIGSGKSTVARAFASLGWEVVDSDKEAAAALQSEEAKRALVGWWGPGVLDAGGGVDRGAVGRLVFADEEKRRALEGLIHPMIARTRAQVLERARARVRGRAGERVGVVFDAPLLFEAGLDGQCDAVVFVDAPRGVRLERVRRSRGWDEAELSRREAAQWAPERKRALCRFVVNNDGETDVVEQCRVISGILLGSSDRG